MTKKDSKLLEIIKKLETINIKKDRKKTIKNFVETYIEPKVSKDKKARREYEELYRKLPDRTTIENYLALDEPVKSHPAFIEEVRDSNTYLLLKESDIKTDENKIAKVIEEFKKPGALSYIDLLVKKNIVTDKELDDIKFTLDLDVITLGNIELISSIKAQGITSIEQLSAYSVEDWNKLIQNTPENFVGNKKDYANHIEAVITSIFPTKTFFHRIKSIREQEIKDSLNKVKKFLKDNPKFKIKEEFPKRGINWGNADRYEKKAIKQKIENLRRFGRQYHHLGITDILNLPNKTPEQKLDSIKAEIAKFDKFIVNNPDLDLQKADFHPKREYIKKVPNDEGDSKFKMNWENISKKKDRQKIVAQLKEYQRIFRIYPRTETVLALIREGFNCANKIASITEARFVKDYSKLLRKDEGFAKRIYRIAKERVNRAALLWANAKDTAGSRIYNPNPGPGLHNNLGAEVVDYIKYIPGYQEIFGEMRFCECPHCRSIYSPAAYFVDLMRFIEKNIPEHTLDDRRPDLKKIELTCENTNTFIPYIELLNEVMEDGIGATEQDRDIPYKTLLSAKYPFNLPFNLNIERIRIFFEHFKTTLSGIYKIFEKFRDLDYEDYDNLTNSEKSELKHV
ncbi:MAG: Tc toxin subunit A, partial [Candidatus Hodarchaeota archaeon]